MALFMCVHPLATAVLDSVVLRHFLTLYDLVGASLVIAGFYFNARAAEGVLSNNFDRDDDRGEYGRVPLDEHS